MRIVALASGSSGNALLVDAGETRILVDCGLGPRILRAHLRAAGVHPETISAVVVTHEHVDHVHGLGHAVKRWPWTIYASAGTIRALPEPVRARARVVQDRVRIGGLEVAVVPVAHDANEPIAVAVTDRASGIRAGIAHDLGVPSQALARAFAGVHLLCVEANHDLEMLRNGPYPWRLKERIAGERGHLSNAQCAAFMDAVSSAELRAVLLLHLSVVNNTPAVACAATRRGITRRARRASLSAAVRRAPSAPIGEAAGVCQLALAI
ncbi:MAG TPA: MBL fold metallo-hydrolase [Gemmatimonadaceae bacterium]|nr:MBL fold metallo-hydrolase [Gemmatimonadaceae bacterium]